MVMSGIKRIGALALILLICALLVNISPNVAAQSDDSEDGPTIEATRTARVQEGTSSEETDQDNAPSADVDDSAADDGLAPESTDTGTLDDPSPNEAAIDVEDIYQTIAQGLAAFDEIPVGVWRISELEPKSSSEAPSVIAPYYGFLYQMDGTTIVRNDNTGKRARLEPGEAYYFSANDQYTRYREDDTSRAWLIEIVPEGTDPGNSAGTVIFTSDPVGNLPDDTRDLELIAGNLIPGEISVLADYEVDVLVMVTVGTLYLSDEDGEHKLIAPSAYLVSSDFTLDNTTARPAVYAVAKVGPSVADATGSNSASADGATANESSEEDATQSEDDESADSGDETLIDSDNDGLIDNDELVYGTDPGMADSDFDGYSDGDEVLNYGTDPLDPNSWP
jgi:hypothetical protein